MVKLVGEKGGGKFRKMKEGDNIAIWISGNATRKVLFTLTHNLVYENTHII